MGAIFASELCVTNSHEHVNKDVRRKTVSEPAPDRSHCGTGAQESKSTEMLKYIRAKDSHKGHCVDAKKKKKTKRYLYNNK